MQGVWLAYILQLDRFSAAAESGRLDLMRRVIEDLAPSLAPDDLTRRLREAARHADRHDEPEAAAYLQSILAARTIEKSRLDLRAVQPFEP